MKEENILDAYNLMQRKHTLERCIEMLDSAKNIDDLQRAHQRSELDIEFPSLDMFKKEMYAGIDSEMKAIEAKIKAL